MNIILNNLINNLINNKYKFIKPLINKGYINNIKPIYHKYRKNNDICIILILIYQLNILTSKEIIYRNNLIKHYQNNTKENDTKENDKENTKENDTKENAKENDSIENDSIENTKENDSIENTKENDSIENTKENDSIENTKENDSIENTKENDSIENDYLFKSQNKQYENRNNSNIYNYTFKNIPKNLLKLYKKCLFKCHPDKTNNVFKQNLFLLLKEIEKLNLPYLIYIIALYLNIKYEIKEIKEIKLLNYYLNVLQCNSSQLFNLAQQSSAEINRMKK